MKHAPENLSPLAIKDFAKKIICDGHLFLRSGDTRAFYVMKPGVLVDPAFVKKHAALQTVFAYQQISKPEIIRQFSRLFKEWRYLQFEKDFRMKSMEIIQLFKEVHSSEEHFLSFALACFQEFNTVPHDRLLKMHEADLHLFQKAFYASAFAVITALCNDFFNYPMVKDFYNLTMCLDIGLAGPNYTYFVAEGCNQENQNPGSGKGWMKDEGATPQEIQVFLTHPEKSHQFLGLTEGILSFQELAEVALYQHELANGMGFPRGIPKNQISSWEAVVIFADSLVEIKDEHGFETKVLKYLGSFNNKKLYDLPVKKIYTKLCSVLELDFGSGEVAG